MSITLDLNSPRVKRDEPTRWTTTSHAESIRGARRDHNADYVLDEPLAGIFAVADGMGQHAGGAEASELLCAVLAGELMETDTSGEFNLARARETLQAAILLAQDGMHELAEVCPCMRKMGSTLTVAWIVNGVLNYGNVGGSRLYLLRNKALARLTKDHAGVQSRCAQCAQGTNRGRHVITRYVGPSSPCSHLDVNCLKMQVGDRLVFVTSGITDVIDDDAIQNAANLAKSPAELCRWLQISASHADADDDTSCLVVDLKTTLTTKTFVIRSAG